MYWLAVKTVPGSQKPQREFVVEPTSLGADGRPRGKGYRIVPSLDPNISAVERALDKAGFTYYMPAEKRLVRDRRHTDLWKVRRFALMVGWLFVHAKVDDATISALLNTPGVDGIVSCAGRPLKLTLAEILLVRAAEADAEVDFDTQTREARKKLRKNAKTDPRLKMLVEKLDIAGSISMPLDSEMLAA
jgi:transcription antitermination factor NusG